MAGMDDIIFNLRMSSKQLERLSVKSEKEEAKQKTLVKKAIEKKNLEGARIYAENAIRKKNEGLNYLRLASRLDAVQNRIKSAMAMKSITRDIGVLTKGLDKAMESMNLKEITKVMDKFESQFADLDTRAGVMDASLAGAFSTSTPEDQVEALMKQVADENHIEITEQLAGAKVGTAAPQQSKQLSTHEEDDLKRRLAELRS